MTYSPDALRAIIRTACLLIDKWSSEAEELLMGTAAKESHLGTLGLVQIGGGPARGVWQMEPATEYDIWYNYLFYRPDLKKLVTAATGLTGPDPRHLQYNPIYGAIMARLHYLRVKHPLPATHEVSIQAEYWDVHYNRNPEKGFPAEYIELYYKLIMRA